MGFFSKLFKSNKLENKKQDFSYIAEIAALISGNDPVVMKNISFCVENPQEYIKSNENRYSQRGSLKNRSMDTLCWLALVDELNESEYLLTADWKDDPEQFLWVLESIKGYDELIDIDISSLEFDPDENIDVWGREINSALNGKAYVCMIDINSDSYELIIVTDDIYEKISKIAESNGHSIGNF